MNQSFAQPRAIDFCDFWSSLFSWAFNHMHFGQSTWRSRHLFLFRGSSTAWYVELRLSKNVENGCPAYKPISLQVSILEMSAPRVPLCLEISQWSGADMMSVWWVGLTWWNGMEILSFFIKTRYNKLALEILNVSLCPSISLQWRWTRLHTDLELSAWHIGVIRSFPFWCLHVKVFFRAWILVITYT